MKVALKKIKPNPFRRTEVYPINRAKVQELKESIESTSFWDNLVARKNGDGVEIAYGHHRLIALRELYGPSKEINVILRDLSDDEMLRIMARENMQEYLRVPEVNVETVHAVVNAFAKGKIKLTPVSFKTSSTFASPIRVAPSFEVVNLKVKEIEKNPLVYTATTVAEFLGWRRSSVNSVLQVLDYQEKKYIEPKHWRGLLTKAFDALVAETSKTLVQSTNIRTRQKERERWTDKKLEATIREDVKYTVNEVSEFLQNDGSHHDASIIGAQCRASRSNTARLPDISRFSISLCTQISKILGDETTLFNKLQEVEKNQEHLTDKQRKQLRDELRNLSKRAKGMAEKF